MGMSTQRIDARIRQILKSYNFIGIVERMDESIVALQMILGLETADVLALNSKVSGTGKVQKTFVTPVMEEYFNSTEYNNLISIDKRFYKAINKSLDKTIQNLGLAKFDVQLQQFCKFKSLIEQTCTSAKWASHLGRSEPMNGSEYCITR